MALWDHSISSSSQGSSPAFPPPHKGCSQPAVPRGHGAVTDGEGMSSEWDCLSLPSSFLPLRSSCLSFRIISCSLFFCCCCCCHVCLFVCLFQFPPENWCWESWESSVVQQSWGWMEEDADAPKPLMGMQETSHGGVWQGLSNLCPLVDIPFPLLLELFSAALVTFPGNNLTIVFW